MERDLVQDDHRQRLAWNTDTLPEAARAKQDCVAIPSEPLKHLRPRQPRVLTQTVELYIRLYPLVESVLDDDLTIVTDEAGLPGGFQGVQSVEFTQSGEVEACFILYGLDSSLDLTGPQFL